MKVACSLPPCLFKATTSQVRDLSRDQCGAMMQQTDRCLLYFGGCLTHLKRSAERGADGPEACPFPSRLTPSVLQNGVSRYPSVPPPCMRGLQRAGVLRPLSHTSRLSARLQRVGVKAALNRHAPSLKARRAAHVPPLSLSLCLFAKHASGRCCGGSGRSGRD